MLLGPSAPCCKLSACMSVMRCTAPAHPNSNADPEPDVLDLRSDLRAELAGVCDARAHHQERRDQERGQQGDPEAAQADRLLEGAGAAPDPLSRMLVMDARAPKQLALALQSNLLRYLTVHCQCTCTAGQGRACITCMPWRWCVVFLKQCMPLRLAVSVSCVSTCKYKARLL